MLECWVGTPLGEWGLASSGNWVGTRPGSCTTVVTAAPTINKASFGNTPNEHETRNGSKANHTTKPKVTEDGLCRTWVEQNTLYRTRLQESFLYVWFGPKGATCHPPTPALPRRSLTLQAHVGVVQLEDSHCNLLARWDPFLESGDMHCGVHLSEVGHAEATDHS